MNKQKIIKAMPTVLFAVGIVGIFVSEVMCARDTLKAEKALNKKIDILDGSELGDDGLVHVTNKPVYAKEVVKATWKCFVPTFFSTTVTITSLAMSKHLTAKQIAALSTAAMSATGLVTRYRKEILERTDEEVLRDIDKAVAEATMKDAKAPTIVTSHLVTGEDFDTASDGEYLFFDPLTKMKFRTTKLAANSARYFLNRNFSLGGCVGLEMFYNFLGLELPEEFRFMQWDMNEMCDDGYAWIDIDFIHSSSYDPETGEDYYIIEYNYMPGELEDGPYTYPFGNPLISEGSVAV